MLILMQIHERQIDVPEVLWKCGVIVGKNRGGFEIV
jgi:hypothetical protein